MSLDRIFGIAGTALNAQLTRMNLTASNLANQGTVNTTENEAFRAKRPVFKAILNEKFHPDIFYLIATVNPSLIDGKLLTSAEDQLKTNNETFKNKLDRFWHVHPIYFGLAIYYQKIDQKKSEQYFHLGNKETMLSLRYNSFDYQKSIGINHTHSPYKRKELF